MLYIVVFINVYLKLSLPTLLTYVKLLHTSLAICQIAMSNGYVKWLCQMAMSNCYVKLLGQIAMSNHIP